MWLFRLLGHCFVVVRWCTVFFSFLHHYYGYFADQCKGICPDLWTLGPCFISGTCYSPSSWLTAFSVKLYIILCSWQMFSGVQWGWSMQCLVQESGNFYLSVLITISASRGGPIERLDLTVILYLPLYEKCNNKQKSNRFKDKSWSVVIYEWQEAPTHTHTQSVRSTV